MKKQNKNCIICKKNSKKLNLGLGMETNSFCSKKCFKKYLKEIDQKGDSLSVEGNKVKVSSNLDKQLAIKDLEINKLSEEISKLLTEVGAGASKIQGLQIENALLKRDLYSSKEQLARMINQINKLKEISG